MYAWYILDTYPLLDKCLANISSQCVACSKFLSGSPLFPPPGPEVSWSSLWEWHSTYINSSDSPSDVPTTWWLSLQGIWTLMCPQMNLLSFPQSISHLEQWHYLVSAGWDQLSLQTLDPRLSPGSIQCCLPIPGLQAACLALAWIAILALFLSSWLLTWPSPWLLFHFLP